jgi:hypothetical protein
MFELNERNVGLRFISTSATTLGHKYQNYTSETIMPAFLNYWAATHRETAADIVFHVTLHKGK